MPKLEIHLPQTADHMGRLALAMAVAAVAAGTFAANATAQDFGSGEPALDEYVEALPLAHGNRPAGHNGRPGRLPASTRRVLAETPQGRLLERVATSPAAGAPGSEGPATAPAPVSVEGAEGAAEGSPVRQIPAEEVRHASLVSAGLDSVGGRAGLLLLALLASVPLALTFTRTRSRQR